MCCPRARASCHAIGPVLATIAQGRSHTVHAIEAMSSYPSSKATHGQRTAAIVGACVMPSVAHGACHQSACDQSRVRANIEACRRAAAARTRRRIASGANKRLRECIQRCGEAYAGLWCELAASARNPKPSERQVKPYCRRKGWRRGVKLQYLFT